MERLVAFIGSPRERSSSRLLLDLFTSSFEGKRTVFSVYRLNVQPCSACGGCYDTGVCVIEDDMVRVYSALDSADYVVVASPIYFYGPPSPLKAVIDRCQPFWVRKFLKKEKMKPKKGALITVGATEGRNLFLPFYYIALVWFNSINASFPLHIKVRGVEEPSDLGEELLNEVKVEGISFFGQDKGFN
ncbi:MAG: flavodoxin family protein [Deferribacteres bacterium]|nr:flavodoxin family protein [Deferribacteres bacterium]